VKCRVIVSASCVLRHQWIVRNNRLSIKYQSVPTTESVSIGRAARLIDVAHRAIAEQRNAIERSNSAANTQMSLLVYTHKYVCMYVAMYWALLLLNGIKCYDKLIHLILADRT